MISKALTKLHARHGKQVFLEAQHALMTPPCKTFRLIASYCVAALLLAVPILPVGFGLWLLITGFGSWVPMFWGVFLLGVGYVLTPRLGRQPAGSFARSDLPATFALIDAIAKAMGTAPPDAFRLLMESNAFAVTYGIVKKQNEIAIGVPLWRVMTPQERIAILAHEIAHFGNGDPARGTFMWLALQVVARWEYLLAPDENPLYAPGLASMITAYMQFIARLPVSLLGQLLLYLQYHDHQRAEYLADGMAAKAVGVEAMQSSLKKLALMDEAYGSVQSLYPFSKDQNGRIFDVTAAKETARVDATHPPTAYRIAFLGLLESEGDIVDAAAFDFAVIENELRAEADRQGRRLMQILEEQ